MLFLLNKTQPNTLGLLQLLGGDEDKEVLLVQDAVFYANEHMVEQFQEVGVEQIYALRDSVQERHLALSAEVELVDYDRVVDLLMEEHDKVVCI